MITNTYDQNVQAGGNRIVIYYSPNSYGRMSRSAHFSVGHFKDGKSFVTDPEAHWQDNYHKTFTVWGNGRFYDLKKQILAKAIAWVTERYGKRDFVRNRQGNYVEREVNEKFPIPPRQTKDKERDNGSKTKAR